METQLFTTHVTEPAKLVRMTTMARAMLEEARSAPCDSAGCERLKRIHSRVILELADVVSAELYEELLTLSVHFDDVAPTPSEVRVAQAELVGWLEGLMAGSVVAQAFAAEMPETADPPGEPSQPEVHGLYL